MIYRSGLKLPHDIYILLHDIGCVWDKEMLSWYVPDNKIHEYFSIIKPFTCTSNRVCKRCKKFFPDRGFKFMHTFNNRLNMCNTCATKVEHRIESA